MVAIGASITQNVYISGEPVPPAFESTVVEARYRAQVVKHYNRMTLTGLPERDPGLNELPLAQIFVKLNVELSQRIEPRVSNFETLSPPPHELLALPTGSGKTESANQMLERFRQVERESRQPQHITLSVAEALYRYRRFVILGGPGSGKTTLTRWLAVLFAHDKQADPENLGPRFSQNRLPVLLELRRFADHVAAASRPGVAPKLAESIATYIHEHAYYADVPAAFVQQALVDGRCLLLFDGLDEIADLGLRRTLSDAIQALWQHPDGRYRDNLVIVTSRPHGYQEVELGGAFQRCEVKDFSPEDVKHFIRAWYATAYGDAEQSEAQELVDAIHANERVGDLARNPLLCTIIAIVYRNNRVLPNRRVELYLKCCEALLDTWERNKAIKESGLIGGYDWQTKLELLAPLAYWLHGEAERLAAPEDEFVTKLAAVLRERRLGDPAKAEQEARSFIQIVCDRSGLLQGRGDGSLEFMHRTFQEYLAARHIAAQPDPDYIDLVMTELHLAWWYEVHLLVIGYLGSNSATAEKASQLLLAILTAQRPPWPWLRSTSFAAVAPGWYRGWVASVPGGLVKTLLRAPYLVRLVGPGLLPRWQLSSRLAWVLQRELDLTVRGYLDCTALGLTPRAGQRLQKLAAGLLLRWALDPVDQRETAPFGAHPGRLMEEIAANHPAVINSLLKLLSDPERSVRTAVARALGQVGQGRAEVVEQLLKLLSDPEWSVRTAAARALVQVGQGRAEVVETLLKLLSDPEGLVREAVARALGQGRAEVVEPLLKLLSDPEWSVRTAAARALGQVGQGGAEVVEPLLKLLSDPGDDPYGFVRAAAARALGQVGQGGVEVVEPLLELLSDPGDDPHGFVRNAVASALAEVVEPLLKLLSDPEGSVRAAAASALGQVGQGGAEVVEPLLELLSDPEGSVRDAAASALGQVGQGGAEVVEPLLKLLSDPGDDPYGSVRYAAARALGQVGQGRAEVVEPLLKLLSDPGDDPHGFVRDAAASALGQLGQGRAEVVEPLLKLLSDPDWSVRAVAARALGQLEIEDRSKHRWVLAGLNRRLHDRSDNVRSAALSAIRSQVEGRRLPGYRWVPLRQRRERKRRFFAALHWLLLLAGAVMAAWALAYLDEESLGMRVLLILFGLIGMGAGLAQIVGRSLRNPWDGEAT